MNYSITPYAGPAYVDAVQRAIEQRDEIALIHLAYGLPQPTSFDVSGPIVGSPVGYYPPRRHNDLAGIAIGAIVGAVLFVAVGALVRLATLGIRKARARRLAS